MIEGIRLVGERAPKEGFQNAEEKPGEVPSLFSRGNNARPVGTRPKQGPGGSGFIEVKGNFGGQEEENYRWRSQREQVKVKIEIRYLKR